MTVLARSLAHARPLVLAALACVLAPMSPLRAQQRPAPLRVWLGTGFGSGVARGGAEGLAMLGELVTQKQPHHFAVRLVLIADPYGSSGDVFGEAGVLYGRTTTSSIGHASLAAGIAFTSLNPCSPRAQELCQVVGVPVVAELAFSALTLLGIGAQLYANVNSKSTYGGVILFAQLGWMP